MNISKESLDFIICVLIDNKIRAENNNNRGINDEYISSIDKVLEELKQEVKNESKKRNIKK